MRNAERAEERDTESSRPPRLLRSNVDRLLEDGLVAGGTSGASSVRLGGRGPLTTVVGNVDRGLQVGFDRIDRILQDDLRHVATVLIRDEGSHLGVPEGGSRRGPGAMREEGAAALEWIEDVSESEAREVRRAEAEIREVRCCANTSGGDSVIRGSCVRTATTGTWPRGREDIRLYNPRTSRGAKEEDDAKTTNVRHLEISRG